LASELFLSIAEYIQDFAIVISRPHCAVVNTSKECFRQINQHITYRHLVMHYQSAPQMTRN